MKRPFFLVFCCFFFYTVFSTIGQDLEGADTLILLREFEIIDDKAEELPYPGEQLLTGRMQTSSLRDVGDFLRQGSNISGIRKGGTNLDPVIRGFKFSQLNVQLNNGQKIEGGCPNRMDPPVSHVDIDDLREAEIIKGPYALRYGPNFGGIINLKNKYPPVSERFRVGLSGKMGYESNWNGLQQQMSVWAGSNRAFLMITGNNKDYGHYTDGNGNEVKSAFRRYNFSAQAGYSPSENHQILATYDRSFGRNISFPALPMDERKDDTRLASFDYKGHISHTINHVHIKLYRSDVDHTMDNKERPFSDTVVAVSRIRAINYGYRMEAGINTGRCQLYFGTDMETILKDGTRTKNFILQPTLPVLKEMLWDGARINNYGFFAEHRKRWSRWEMISSVRLDLNDAASADMVRENMEGNPVFLEQDTDSKHRNFSISVGTRYHLSGNLILRLSAGRAQRSPDMNERFITLLPIGYDPYDYLGNPQLKPETNNQADLGVIFTQKGFGVLEGGIFFSFINNYISGVLLPESIVKPQTRGVLGVKQFDNTGDVWLTGFEIRYRSPVDLPFGLILSGGYTYGVNPSATVYTVEAGEVTGQETVKNDPLSEIPPFEANLHFHYHLLEGDLTPGVHLRAATSQNRTSAAFSEVASPGFITTDIFISYRVFESVVLSAGVNNLFDKAYYEHLNRRIVGSRENFYEPGRVAYFNLKFDL